MSTSSTSAWRFAAFVSSYARSRIAAARARLADGEQALDDLDGAWVVGRQLECAPARVEGVDVPAQRIGVQPRELDLASGALGAFALIAIERDDLHGPGRIALGAQQPSERPERHPVLRNELEHAPVQSDRTLGRSERLFFEDRPLGQEVELERGVRALDAQIEQPAQVVPAVGFPQEAIERLHRSVVGLVLFDERSVDAHGVVRACHLARVHLGHLGAQRPDLVASRSVGRVGGVLLLFALLAGRRGRRGPRGLQRLEADGQRLDEPVPRSTAPGGARRFLEGMYGLVARGRELVGLAGPLERGRAILELMAGDPHELLEQGELRVDLARVREQDLVEGREPHPLLVLLVQRRQRQGRAGVARANR